MVRKVDREEVAVRAAGSARSGDAGGRGGAVVAVRNVDRRQRVEGARQFGDRRLVIDDPHLVAHAIVGGDVDGGGVGGGLLQERTERRRGGGALRQHAA